MFFIKKYNAFLIREMTEFNLQRFNSDSARIAPHVDDPQLSTDAFDKHQSAIRVAMSRIDDILFNMKGSSSYSALRSKLALEDQDIEKIKILKIVKKGVGYDVYLTTTVDEVEYWGKVSNIIGLSPEFTSEIFKDMNLYQPKEWVIKIRGLVIKTLKAWLKPEPGIYKLIKDETLCYSVDTGRQLKMNQGIEIELVRAHDDKIIIKYDNDYYNLVDDNFIYFNWWFENLNPEED